MIFREEVESKQHLINHGRIVGTREGKVEGSGMEGKWGSESHRKMDRVGYGGQHRKEWMTRGLTSWELLRMSGVMGLVCSDCSAVAKKIHPPSSVNGEKAWADVDSMWSGWITSCKELLFLKNEEMKGFRRKWSQGYRRFEKIPNFH